MEFEVRSIRKDDLLDGLLAPEVAEDWGVQRAWALDLLQRARHARAVLTRSGGDAGVIARIASALEDLDEEQREPVLRLLGALDDVLRADVSF